MDVERFDDLEWYTYDSVETDAEGIYRLSDVQPGRYRAGLNLRGQHEPYPVLYSPGVDDPERGSLLLISEDEPAGRADFWLPEPKLRHFEIQVFWADGTRAKDAMISLVFGRWPNAGELRTDEVGRVTVTAYALMNYRLYAHGRRSPAETELASVPVEVDSREQRIWVPLVLAASPPEELGPGIDN